MRHLSRNMSVEVLYRVNKLTIRQRIVRILTRAINGTIKTKESTGKMRSMR